MSDSSDEDIVCLGMSPGPPDPHRGAHSIIISDASKIDLLKHEPSPRIQKLQSPPARDQPLEFQRRREISARRLAKFMPYEILHRESPQSDTSRPCALDRLAPAGAVLDNFPATNSRTHSHLDALARIAQYEDDASLASRIALEEEAKCNQLQVQEAQDAVYARAMAQAEALAERRWRETQKTEGKRRVNQSQIIFKVTMDANGRTVEGDEDAENAAHLALVKQDFDKAGANGLRIVKITYFVNFELNRRFEAAKATLDAQGKDVSETTMFHGTATANIQPILENGFKIGSVGGHSARNGVAHGVEVYLGHSPFVSVPYCLGDTRMFACRVILGSSTRTPMGTQPLAVGQNLHDSYEGPGLSVIRSADCVLPKYLVEFSGAPIGMHLTVPAALPVNPMMARGGNAGGWGAVLAHAQTMVNGRRVTSSQKNRDTIRRRRELMRRSAGATLAADRVQTRSLPAPQMQKFMNATHIDGTGLADLGLHYP